MPTTELILIMDPFFALSIGFCTAFTKLNTAFKFAVITSSHCVSLILINNPSRVIPALFTKMSIVPNSAVTLFTSSSAALKSPASLL